MSEEVIKNNEELDLEDLNEVAGGYTVDTKHTDMYRNNVDRYLVVNDKNGREITTMPYPVLAYESAKKHGQSDAEISVEQLRRLRQTGRLD